MLHKKMTLMVDHRFSDVIKAAHERRDPTNWWDTILRSSTHFVAIATTGAITAGWVLIIPKRPVSNISMLCAEEKSELLRLILDLKNILARTGYEFYEFEHGDTFGTAHNCCVDQAHLHLVQLPFDLVSRAITKDTKLFWRKENGGELPRRSEGHSPYLYVRSGHGAYIAHPFFPQSQWFRKLIAENLSIPSKWNYRKYPFLSNTLETIERFHPDLIARRRGPILLDAE